MEWNQELALTALEKMKQRASCRSFEEKEIPEEILKNIIETGLRAATGGNLQPYSIVVVKDKERRKKLAELNENQNFMAQAPVNLVFVLDWNRNGRLAKLQKAPYTAFKSYMHYMIGLEDLMCAAQTIETAAWFMGIGSCYIGTCNFKGAELSEMLNLPEHTYPMVVLTMGYPKHELPLKGRLPYEDTVFEEQMRILSDEEILTSFGKKYGKLERELSSAPKVRAELLETMRINLEASYTKEEAAEILKEIQDTNKYGEYMYRFGLHYGAAEMLAISKEVLEQMSGQKLEPFINE